MTSLTSTGNPAVDPQAGSFQLALAKKAKITSPTAVIDGVLKNVVTVASINQRYAILHAQGRPASTSAVTTFCRSKTTT